MIIIALGRRTTTKGKISKQSGKNVPLKQIVTIEMTSVLNALNNASKLKTTLHEQFTLYRYFGQHLIRTHTALSTYDIHTYYPVQYIFQLNEKQNHPIGKRDVLTIFSHCMESYVITQTHPTNTMAHKSFNNQIYCIAVRQRKTPPFS